MLGYGLFRGLCADKLFGFFYCMPLPPVLISRASLNSMLRAVGETKVGTHIHQSGQFGCCKPAGECVGFPQL